MNVNGCPVPCDDCPALRTGSFSVGNGETVITQQDDEYRVISVYAEGNVAGFSDELLDISPYDEPVKECTGAQFETREIHSRKWAGLIKFTKTIDEATCLATGTKKIRSVR